MDTPIHIAQTNPAIQGQITDQHNQLDEDLESMHTVTRLGSATHRRVLQKRQAQDMGQEPARKRRFVDEDGNNQSNAQETASMESPSPGLEQWNATTQALTDIYNPTTVTEPQTEGSEIHKSQRELDQKEAVRKYNIAREVKRKKNAAWRASKLQGPSKDDTLSVEPAPATVVDTMSDHILGNAPSEG